MQLDVRGQISAAVIGFYVPVVVFSFIRLVRYGFRRDAGWAFLLLFSLVRIVSGSLIVAGENVSPRNNQVFVAGYTLYDAGLPILFLAVLGFLGLAGQHSYSEIRAMHLILRGKGILCLAALAFCIAGDVEAAGAGQEIHTGMILRRISAVILAIVYVLLFFSHMHAMSYGRRVLRARRSLLRFMFLALPFLGVRTAYYILNAWSSADLWGGIPSQNPTLPQFNIVSGDWIPFLIMLLVMEYIAALIYMFSGSFINFHRDGY